MSQSEFYFEDETDMKLLNKIDAKVRKHAKVVVVLKNEQPEKLEESIW